MDAFRFVYRGLMPFYELRVRTAVMGRTLQKLFLSCFVLLIFCSSYTTSIAADVEFSPEIPPKYTFPLPGSDTISFLLSSTGGIVSKVKIQVQQIKDPDGQSRSTDVIEVIKEEGKDIEVTSDGIPVILKPKSAFFVKPGDYIVTLNLSGQVKEEGKNDKQINKKVNLTINHPEPDINTEELKDQIIALTKKLSSPREAEGVVRFTLREITGKAAVQDLEVCGQTINVKEKKTWVPGQITIKPAQSEKATPCTKITLGPGGSQELELAISGLQQVGTFTTQLAFTSPYLKSGKTIPLTITVTDVWLYPLLFFTLGVLGGFLTTYLLERYRPRKLNYYLITRYRCEVDNLQQVVTDSGKRKKLLSIGDSIRNAAERNDLGDTARAAEILRQVEKDLVDFRNAEVSQNAEAHKTLTGLRALAQEYQQRLSGDLTTGERAELSSISNSLMKAENLLMSDQVDRAKEELSRLSNRLKEFENRHLKSELKELKDLLAGLNPAATDEELKKKKQSIEELKKKKQSIEGLVIQAETLLDSGNTKDAGKKIEEIATAVKELKKAISGTAEELSIASVSSVSRSAEESLRGRMHIRIVDPIPNRTTDTNISFEIVDPQNEISSADKFEWDFGEGGSILGSRTASHRFRAAGNYVVKVNTLRGEPAEIYDQLRELREPISILPGRSERALEGMKRDIRASDWVLLGIAIILAILSGMLFNYAGKVFGTLSDYLLAILWGFGIKSAVDGFSDALKKIRGPGNVLPG